MALFPDVIFYYSFNSLSELLPTSSRYLIASLLEYSSSDVLFDGLLLSNPDKFSQYDIEGVREEMHKFSESAEPFCRVSNSQPFSKELVALFVKDVMILVPSSFQSNCSENRSEIELVITTHNTAPLFRILSDEYSEVEVLRDANLINLNFDLLFQYYVAAKTNKIDFQMFGWVVNIMRILIDLSSVLKTTSADSFMNDDPGIKRIKEMITPEKKLMLESLDL